MPIRRTIKNVVKNYTEAQIKVREATSNDPWGPSSTMMSEIADLTYNVLAFTEIMQMVWKRLNDHGKNWRHVYKSLVLLDYIIKTGSEKVAQQCKENIFAIETLKNFQYVEDGKDHGMNVREKAKQLVQLLKDDERLKNERAKALKAKERFAQNTMGIGSGGGGRLEGAESPPPAHSGYSDLSANAAPTQNAEGDQEMEAARPSTAGEEELQLQLALAMSREEHEEDEKRKKQDDIKLQMALEESKKNDAKAESDTLLDLSLGAGAGAAAAAAAASAGADPWGGNSQPAQQQQQQPQQQADPWGGKPEPVAPAADPWGSPAKQADPWTPSQSQTTTPMQPNDPWASTTSNGAVPAKPAGLDDEFDMLSSRSKSPGQGAAAPPAAGGAGQPMSNGNSNSSNPWDLGGMGSSLPPSHSGGMDLLSAEDLAAKSKSPEQFLGTHANLVNLDNLVTKPEPTSSTNPFALTNPGGPPPGAPAPNPFAAQQAAAQQQRVPLNQMTSSASMGFAPAPPQRASPAGFMASQPPAMGGSPAFGQPMPTQQPPMAFPAQPPPQPYPTPAYGQNNNPFL